MIFMQEEGSICLHDDDNILIFPLLIEEIEMLKEDINYFQNYINLNYLADYDFSENSYMEKQLQLFKNSKNPLPWLSIWVIVSVQDKAIIGTINFKNEPTEEKVTEIGYSISKEFRNFGYATTAIKLIVDWAFKNGVKKILAQTQKENLPSQKVLINNNFAKFDENNEKIAFFKENK